MMMITRKDRDAMKGTLGKDRHGGLVDHLARIVRAEFEAGNIGSKLGLEGPMGHAVRGNLCLQGWRWHDANTAAHNLMTLVQLRIGATRPSWNEGQPEWTIEAGTLIERTDCANCRKPLPEESTKFCSYLCAQAHHGRLKSARASSEAMVIHTGTQAI
jgi:hypothetical protein